MSIASSLSDKQFSGYLRRQIPHELDGAVEKVVAAYRSGTHAAKQALLDDLNPRTAGVLSSYGERMAAVAVRARSDEPLRRGIVAVGMADGKLDDSRTNLVVLAAINHSAESVGTDLSRLINDLQSDLPPSALANLRAFVQRNERDKSLQAMGLATMGSGDSFRYTSG